MTSRSRLWLVAGLAALLVFSVPIITADALIDRDPEVRLIRTGNRFSALVVTSESRVLVINSEDRRNARSAIGRLARPWEPDITTLIAPADDRSAAGLWEALRHPSVQQVVVIGLPGSNQVWSEIEDEAASRHIPLQYVAQTSTAHATDVTLTLAPPTRHAGSHIEIRRGHYTITLALDEGPPLDQTTVAVLNDAVEDAIPADLLLLPSSAAYTADTPLHAVRNDEVVRLVLRSDEIGVQGGEYLRSEPEAN